MGWYENLTEDEMILAEEQSYGLDCYKTGLNNNVLVCGTSGSGKTRGIVTPNLLMASGSYVLSDPKGNLYTKWKDYFEKKGYEVIRVDFVDLKESVKYNPLVHIQNEYDILKMAHQFVYDQDENKVPNGKDPFWDKMQEQYICALLAYLFERGVQEKLTISEVLRLARLSGRDGGWESSSGKSKLNALFQAHEVKYGDTFACRMFKQMDIAPTKTYSTIVSTLISTLGIYETKELSEMMSINEIDFKKIAQKKTIVFVIVSDTDRTLDRLANLFFSQAMHTLCRYADKECADNRLPIPVRFILDDFATNVKIEEFPRMISSIRSRGISTVLMIQAESQLVAGYGADGHTIIANCDTYVYLGTNEVETMEKIAKRCNARLEDIMYMPVGQVWIFRRGQRPIYAKPIDYDRFLKARMEMMERDM